MLILFLFVALTVPSLIHHEISWLFSKQMWPIFNSSNTITLLTFQNSSGIHFNIYSHIKSLCAYSHNILTEWDKSSLRGSACKWSLVFSVKMPPNMIWNTKYHLWHLFPLGIWISLLRKLLPSCCWEAVEREEGQWRTISISAHVRQTADHTNKCSDQKRFFNGLLG